MSVNEKMTAIADAIRAKTGKTETLNLDQMTQSIPEVYEAGEKSAYDKFWDGVQNYGKRTEYQSAFARWGNSIIEPKYPIKVSNAYELFRSCSNLTAIPDNLTFDTTATNCSIYTAFYYCSKLVRIDQELKGRGATGIWNSFTGCTSLVYVKKLTVDATCTNDLNNTFAQCVSLTDIEFAGTISANYLNVQWSPLTHDSLISLLNTLGDKTGDTSKTWTVTLGATNLAKLTIEEQKIAYNKGWDLG